MLWLSIPLSAQAADLLVGPAQPYASVGDALAVAASGDRILVDPGTYDESALTVGALTVEVRAAGGPGTVVLRAVQGAALFSVGAGGGLTLAEVEVDGLGDRRLAVVVGGSLTVEGCVVHDTAPPNGGQAGGAIDADSATIVIRGSTFERSDAGNREGGLVRAVATAVELADSTLRAGAASDGGGLALRSGSALIADRVVFEGLDANRGSAVDASDSDLLIRASTFLGNTAGDGTVRCVRGAVCAVEGTTFEGNGATRGAALQADGPTETRLLASTVCGATGSRVVDLANTTAQLANDVFLSNTVGDAVVRVGVGANAQIWNDHFVGNTATAAGTALVVEGSADLVNTLIAWQDGPGAAVVAAAGTLTGGWSAYWQNAAADRDGALFATDLSGIDPLLPTPVPGDCDPSPFAPSAGSPLVDAGHPKIYDLDGTPSDIGAWGGGASAPPIEPVDEDGDGWYPPLDCDDADPAIHPGQAELACDGIDQDCDPGTPDAVDADGDGFDVCTGDCDDNNPQRSEIVTVYRDRDLDGFGTGQPVEVCGMPFDASLVDGDCDDDDPDRFPGNPEIPYDGVDQDCDAATLDDDLDGDGAVLAEDCDDDDPERFDAAEDLPDDGIDQDCSGFDTSASFNGSAGIDCGCAATGPRGGFGAALVALPLLWLRRRRR